MPWFGAPTLTQMPQEVQDELAACVPSYSSVGRPEHCAKLAQQISTGDLPSGDVMRLDVAIRMATK